MLMGCSPRVFANDMMVAEHSSEIRIGTRKSPLAMAQAREVADLLLASSPAIECQLVGISTAGDRDLSRPIRDIGGKQIFCRELELALLGGDIDIAVHSLKDMPTEQPPGLVIDCVPKRADPRDALISAAAGSLKDLPDGSTIGTSSLRRRAQILRLNDRLSIVDLRGNLDTRLQKLENGLVDALVLSLAGLQRLGRLSTKVTAIPVDEMLPAAGQAAICVERRSDDHFAAQILSRINDRDALLATRTERSCLAEIDGSCMSPLAAYAEVEDGNVHLRGEVYRLDGSDASLAEGRAATAAAFAMGKRVGRQLRNAGILD